MDTPADVVSIVSSSQLITGWHVKAQKQLVHRQIKGAAILDRELGVVQDLKVRLQWLVSHYAVGHDAENTTYEPLLPFP